MPKSLERILNAEIDPAFAKRARFILRAIETEKSRKILDAGCGRGFYPHALSFFAFPKEIHGIDISNEYLSIARQYCTDKRVRLQKGSLYSLPYPDNYFDAVICSEVLEHLDNDTAGARELHRVLKKDGLLLVSVPNERFPFLWDPINWLLMRLFNTHVNKDIWWLAGIWADHDRLYKREDLESLIVRSGFVIKKLEHTIGICLPFSHFLLYGIGKNLIEKCGLKTFNRFEFGENRVASLLAWIFRFPSRWDSKKQTISMNILISARKQ